MRVKRSATGLTIIVEEDVNDLFIKGNMKLVTDVWNVIMDVVEPELLLRYQNWANRLLKTTYTILAWYLTFLFELPDPMCAIAGDGC